MPSGGTIIVSVGFVLLGLFRVVKFHGDSATMRFVITQRVLKRWRLCSFQRKG